MTIPDGIEICDECCLPQVIGTDHECLGQGHNILYDFNQLVIDKSRVADNQ